MAGVSAVTAARSCTAVSCDAWAPALIHSEMSCSSADTGSGSGWSLACKARRRSSTADTAGVSAEIWSCMARTAPEVQRRLLVSNGTCVDKRRSCVMSLASTRRSRSRCSAFWPLSVVVHPVAGVTHGLVQLQRQSGRQAPGQHDAVDQRGADDAQADLFNAGKRGVEHQRRVRHAGKADHRGGVAGQHEEVRPRGAVQHRHVQAGAHPQHHRRRHDDRRIRQPRHHVDGGGRPDEGADQAVQRFGAHGARPGLRHDVGGGHCPERTRQTNAVGQIKRHDGA